jgi:predicted house-cleaning noncanonical NTP pyrophosphatase (MazG superfamily)
MRYDKLVRDRIPDIIMAKGESCMTHIADEAEYEAKLFEKLREEANELVRDKSVGEIADVLEVIDAIAALKGFSKEEIDAIKQKKFEERGGFSGRVILEES